MLRISPHSVPVRHSVVGALAFRHQSASKLASMTLCSLCLHAKKKTGNSDLAVSRNPYRIFPTLALSKSGSWVEGYTFLSACQNKLPDILSCNARTDDASHLAPLRGFAAQSWARSHLVTGLQTSLHRQLNAHFACTQKTGDNPYGYLL